MVINVFVVLHRHAHTSMYMAWKSIHWGVCLRDGYICVCVCVRVYMCVCVCVCV